jgi:predicted DNA-binding protein (MmcQ/YjbR family)
MNPEWVRELCLSLAGATEHVIWGNDLTFKVAGKIFAHTVLEPAPVWLSFKVTPQNFYELTERQNIIPAPYLARAQWIALQTRDALRSDELGALIRESYALVVAKLPKKTQQSLSATGVKTAALRPSSKRMARPRMAKRQHARRKKARGKKNAGKNKKE